MHRSSLPAGAHVTADEIRALGFEWPGSPTVDQYTIETADGIDLDATLAAMRRGLEVYQRELDDIQRFVHTWNPDPSDVGDRRGEVAAKVSEFRQGIDRVLAIQQRRSKR